MMKRLNPIFFVGLIIIVGALVATTLVLPVFTSDKVSVNLEGGSGSSAAATATVGVTPLGLNGDNIYNVPYSLTTDSRIFSSVRVSILWDITGTNVLWDTLTLKFKMEIYLDNEDDVLRIDQWEDNVINKGISLTYDLDYLLASHEDWTGIVFFALTIEATITDTNGYTLKQTLDHKAALKITIDTPEVDSGIQLSLESITTESDVMTTDEALIASNMLSYSQVGGSLNPIENPVVSMLIIGVCFLVAGIWTMRRQ